MELSDHHSTLVPHPRRITPNLLPLATCLVPKPALLPPAPAIAILLIKLPDRAQTAHILANARADLLHRLVEMSRLQRSLFRVFVLVGFGRILGVSGRGVELLAHAGEGGCDAEVLEVGSGVEGCLGSEVGNGDVGVEEFGFEVDLEDCFPVLLHGQIDEEAARQATEGCFVEIKGTVRGDHDECGELRHAVPLAQELVDEFTVTGSIAAARARTEDGVGFVDEDDAGRELFG